MSLKILAVIVGLVFYSGVSLAECILPENPYGERPFKLNLSESECALVRYTGGHIVTISVNYPDMKIVSPRIFDRALITFRLLYVPGVLRNQGGSIAGKKPISVIGGVELYDFGSSFIRRFLGADGSPVLVVDGPYTYIATRLFNNDIQVLYQYSLVNGDLMVIDDFALDFLKKIIRK